MRHSCTTVFGVGSVTVLAACATAATCSKDGVASMCLCDAAPKVNAGALSLASEPPLTAVTHSSGPRNTTLVHVFNFDYSAAPSGPPVDPTISVGDTIHWQWDSGFHSVTSVAGSVESFGSGVHSSPGFTFDHVFTHAGTFWYYCTLHGFDNGDGTAGNMAGFITVTAPTSSWQSDFDGSWNTATNWTNGFIPNGAGHVANFPAVITGPRAVNVLSATTVGTINFDSPSFRPYMIAGGPTLSLAGFAGANTGVNVMSGSHTIVAPLTVVNDVTFDVAPASSGLTVHALQPAPSRAIIKAGAGNLALNRVQAATLTVNAGTVTLAPAAGGASSLALLSVAPGAALDLTDNDLVTGTPKSTVETLVRNGRNAGAWTGTGGITSTNARNLATTGLGVLSGAEYTSVGGNGTFSGLAYAATDTLVKYTWNGDANFDGRVTFDDYVKIDTGFNAGLTGWLNGDFNYSGAVSFDDYVLIDIAFNQQNGTLGRAIDWISGDNRSGSGRATTGVQEVIAHFDQFGLPYAQAFLAAVPEPAGAGIILLSLPVLTSVRSRRRRA